MWEVIGVWVEAVALVGIFVLDWREYRRQGKERQEQHKETMDQIEALQRQADAARDNAIAAKASADALIATERAWLDGEFEPVQNHLGGFNFQWAWASGAAAGRAV
jgi:hypothetical protein